MLEVLFFGFIINVWCYVRMPTIEGMWHRIRDSLESFANKYEDPTYRNDIVASAFRDFLKVMHENMTYREFYEHYKKINKLPDALFTVADLPQIHGLKKLMRNLLLLFQLNLLKTRKMKILSRSA